MKQVIRDIGSATKRCLKVFQMCNTTDISVLETELDKALAAELAWAALFEEVNHLDFEESLMEAFKKHGWDPEVARQGAAYLFNRLTEGCKSKNMHKLNFQDNLLKVLEHLKFRASRGELDSQSRSALELAENLEKLGENAWSVCTSCRGLAKEQAKEDRPAGNQFVSKLRSLRAVLRLIPGKDASVEMAALDELVESLEKSASHTQNDSSKEFPQGAEALPENNVAEAAAAVFLSDFSRFVKFSCIV